MLSQPHFRVPLSYYQAGMLEADMGRTMRRSNANARQAACLSIRQKWQKKKKKNVLAEKLSKHPPIKLVRNGFSTRVCSRLRGLAKESKIMVASLVLMT